MPCFLLSGETLSKLQRRREGSLESPKRPRQLGSCGVLRRAPGITPHCAVMCLPHVQVDGAKMRKPAQSWIEFAQTFPHPLRRETDLSNHQIHHEAAHVHSLSHPFDRFAWRMPDAGGTGTTYKPTPLRRHSQTKPEDDRPKPENDEPAKPVRDFVRSSAFRRLRTASTRNSQLQIRTLPDCGFA